VQPAKVIRFPDPTKPAARPLAAGVVAAPGLERFDASAAESLYHITQSVMDHSRELLEYVDGNRDEIKPAGIETIAIELSGLIEGGGLQRVRDTLEEAILKRRSADITIEGLGRVRRAEGLLAEASSRISKFIGIAPGNKKKLGDTPNEKREASSSLDILMWAPFIVIGVVALAAVYLGSRPSEK
jgi:hypothetical protein